MSPLVTETEHSLAPAFGAWNHSRISAQVRCGLARGGVEHYGGWRRVSSGPPCQAVTSLLSVLVPLGMGGCVWCAGR